MTDPVDRLRGRVRAHLGGLLGLILAMILGTVAQAETIRIDTGGDPSARLELRTVRLPSGEERELYVISAEQVVVRTEDQTLIASRIEFDPDAGILRIIGRGSVETGDETLIGDDLVVELDGGRMDGDDVLVITDRVDVRGDRASRVEGRIRLLAGAFSPCARCGQRTEDFGFVAERIELLPGDRLIAWNATLLIREAPVLDLPLLVVPLADPSRTPRLALTAGGPSERAELRIDWPYVSGANAFGTVSLRLLADVDPTAGGFLGGSMLGGGIERLYLAGEVDHRFFDARGSGRLEAAYRPSPPGDGDGPAPVRFVAAYETDEALDGPFVSLLVQRDDAVRDRLVETRTTVSERLGGVRAELSSWLAIPLHEDADLRPTWDGAADPRTVPLRLRLEPASLEDLRVGPVRVDALELDLGVFEDTPDPTNRSAAGTRFVTAGRVLERHLLVLEPVTALGVELQGRLDFVGRYYDTGERSVDWDTWVSATRRFGELGSVTVRLQRDTAEGETPFAFDRIPLRTRSDLTVQAELRPVAGLDLSLQTGYVFEDDRRPDEVGFGPIETRLRAFGGTRWLDLTLTHRADPRREDLGAVDALVAARATGRDLVAEVRAEARLDLDPSVPEGTRGDESEARFEAALGLADLLVARAETGLVATPPPSRTSGPWEPLELTLTAGTLTAGDPRPGLEVALSLDPNDGTTLEAGYHLTVDVLPFRADLRQRFGPADGPPGDHLYRLAWTDVVALEVEGPELLPAEALDLAPDPTVPRRVSVRLQEDRPRGSPRFRAEYRTLWVPVDDGFERRTSTLTASAQLAERRLPGGWGRVALDAFVDVPLPDDAQEYGYLRRANLEFGLDVAGRVGLQGSIGYRGRYDAAVGEVTSGRLALDDVSLVVHPNDELYLGAALTDVWEIVGDAPSGLGFDPRPRLFAAWDRCCWALYTSWDTRTGEVMITLGAPGVREGPQFAFAEGPVVPWIEGTP